MKLKAYALALALVSGIGLGGCSTITDPATGQTTQVPPNISEIIAQVQAACTTACKFIPTAGTIASIVSAGNPGVIGATAIADAICAAITKAAPMAGRKGASVNGVVVNGWRVSAKFSGTNAVPMVNGVPIKGRFVN